MSIKRYPSYDLAFTGMRGCITQNKMVQMILWYYVHNFGLVVTTEYFSCGMSYHTIQLTLPSRPPDQQQIATAKSCTIWRHTWLITPTPNMRSVERDKKITYHSYCECDYLSLCLITALTVRIYCFVIRRILIFNSCLAERRRNVIYN